jgi:hypothetical protein
MARLNKNLAVAWCKILEFGHEPQKADSSIIKGGVP